MPTEKHFESYAERQIREAMERGDFDDLPGSGQPLGDLSTPYDPNWWAKGFLSRERAHDRADEVRRVIRDELPRLRTAADQEVAQQRVLELSRMAQAVDVHLPESDRIGPVEL